MTASPKIKWADDARVQMANAPVVTDAVDRLADELLGAARSLAPEDTGAYRDGLVVVETVDPDGTVTRTVRGTDEKSALIEYGSGPREDAKGANRGEMPAYFPLSRAVDVLGLRMKPAR